jgi:hypothetical protein
LIDMDVPAGPRQTALTRGFAACLASVTELPVSDIPFLELDLARAVGAWQSWLAGRGSGLVPIAEPWRFEWAGWWIAVVEDGDSEIDRDIDQAGDRRGDLDAGSASDGAVAAVAFGSPSGIVLSPQAPSLVGRACRDLPIRAGYVVASMDPVLWTRPAGADEPESALRGSVVALAVAPAAEAPMRLVDSAQVRAGRGLDGDRYFTGEGTFSPRAGRRPGYDLTLIAAEVLDDLAAEGHDVDFSRTRRNVLTRGIDVNALVRRHFRIGDVLCVGRRLCEPCAQLERLAGPGLLRPLIHRGGLRVDVLSDGVVSAGSPISTV